MSPGTLKIWPAKQANSDISCNDFTGTGAFRPLLRKIAPQHSSRLGGRIDLALQQAQIPLQIDWVVLTVS